jgi:serine/threonine-protein kinase
MLPELPLNYEFLGEIAQGWTFAIYKVRDRRFNRVMALKTLATEEAASPAVLQHLLFEARVQASLEHPNIVELHQVSEFGGRPYLHMEFVEGGSLADRLDGTPWPVRQAAQLAESVARALQAVHQTGIVHRDIVPSHILLMRDGQPKITGFGSAARVGQEANGAIMGTPSYISPEQALGKGQVNPTTDMYSLGAVLYELLTGRPPFREETVMKTILRVVNDKPVPIRRLKPDVPRDLETICLTCLAKQPCHRYSTAEALADDLRRFLEGQPIAARPPGVLKRTWRWWAMLSRRHSR